jgi:hypothetical protein
MAALSAWLVSVALAAAAGPAGAGLPGASDALAAAMADAASGDPARHQRLRDQLETPAFLQALDSPADYRLAAKLRLHVDKVVVALAKNDAPSARAAFVALTSNATYLAHDERVIGLILASVNVRPAPPELVRFWDRRSRPDDGFTPTTIAALTSNGSPEAIALLERKLVDPAQPAGDKVSWMRSDLLEHRNDLPLLQGCERLLSGKLQRKLRPSLVEVLFDYRPQDWFRPASTHSAPSLSQASADARAQLRKVAALALKSVALSATQRAAVVRRVQELDALDREGPR